MIIEIFSKLPQDHILLGIIYRRPQGHYPFEFFNSLHNHLHAFKHIIITGDINADRFSNNPDIKCFQKLISNSALHQLNLGVTHTHIRDTTTTSSIDTFIVDSITKAVSYHTTPAPIAAGHHGLYLKYKIFSPTPIHTYTFRSFKNFNSTQANLFLQSTLSKLPPISPSSDVLLFIQLKS